MNIGKRILALLLLSAFFLSVSMSSYASETSAPSVKSMGKVTGYEKFTWGISTGRYYVNGIHAFCAQYNKKWPAVNTDIETIVPCENEVIRKALYYGYNGPANILGTDEKAHVLTAIAISDANIGERETGASAKYDAFYWDIVNNSSKYPTPPTNFKAYMAITASEDLQNLAFYEVEEKGHVKVIKSSTNPKITNGNSCYSLEGAQYSIYRDSSCSEQSKVGTVTTDADGNSNILELDAGVYYACETTAPQGYEKSHELKEFTVSPEETVVLQFQDVPYTKPIELLLEKVDKETGENKAQGLATLGGAEFEVRFYKEHLKEGVNPDSLGKVPERIWVFKTDENGKIFYKQSHLISGDALYEKVPLGTIAIQEVKSSPGYLLNETVFVEVISANEEYKSVVVEEEYDKPDPYELVIHKKDVYGNSLCDGQFVLYTDRECTKEFATGTTDTEGILRLQGLEMGQAYYLKETAAPPGYEMMPMVQEIVAIYNPITETFSCQVDGKTYQTDTDDMITLKETAEKREVHIELMNEIKYRLPQTGTYARPIISVTGIVLCSISIFISIKEKRRKTK